MLKRTTVGTVLLSLIGFLMAGCGGKAKPDAAPPRMAMQVVVIEAKQEAISEIIALVGNLLANESVEIKSEIDGTIAEIAFQEGQPVEKGDLLIRLDERKLVAAVAEAEANFKLSQLNFERNEQLFKEKLISQQESDQTASQFQIKQANLELQRQQLRDARIVAPFSGMVGGRTVSPGQVVAKGVTLTWLTDVDPIKVEVSVPERFVSQLKIGQRIAINVAAYPGKKFEGEIYFIAEQVDPATRTAFVKAELPNPELQLKPGMFANIDLTLSVREKAVVIPETALNRVMEGNRATVFVVDENSTAQIKPVKMGIRLAGRVEILEGLQAGDKVVVEGIQKIGPGSPVVIASQAEMSNAPTNAPVQTQK